jgi:hypothetical protein
MVLIKPIVTVAETPVGITSLTSTSRPSNAKDATVPVSKRLGKFTVGEMLP